MGLSWRQQTENALLFIVMAGAYFAFLGSRGLNEPDECRYAELGREMVVSGDWLTPHLNGFEHFQKPPVLYWLTALSLKVFGINEWAARLPSTLAALGTLVLTGWMAGALFGKSCSRTAILMLSSSFLFFVLAHFLTPDMVMTFFITASLACLVRLYRGGSWVWQWVFFATMGFGFLTKGPMALVIPMSAALALRYALRRDGAIFPLPWGGGLLLTLSIGVSWFIAMVILHPGLVDYFLRYELLNRFASHTHGRAKPFWFFVPVLVGGFLPWTAFAPFLIRDAWQHHRTQRTIPPELWFLLGWLVPAFVLITLSGSKLATYVLPLLPACALIIAGWWQYKNYSIRSLFFLSGLSLTFLLLLASQAERVNDRFGRQASVRSLAAQIHRQPGVENAMVFTCNVRSHGLEFYLQKLVSVTRSDADIVLPVTSQQQKRLFDSPLHCSQEMTKEKTAYGLIRAADFERYFPAEKWEILAQAGDFLLIGRRK